MWEKIYAAAAALAVLSSPVLAEPARCMQHADALKALSDRYKETPVAMGIGADGRLFEVLASRDGVTWTVMATNPDGVSCLLASGESWYHRPMTVLLPGA